MLGQSAKLSQISKGWIIIKYFLGKFDSNGIKVVVLVLPVADPAVVTEATPAASRPTSSWLGCTNSWFPELTATPSSLSAAFRLSVLIVPDIPQHLSSHKHRPKSCHAPFHRSAQLSNWLQNKLVHRIVLFLRRKLSKVVTLELVVSVTEF